MKREIEFRGKRIDNGEWVYGDLEYSRIADAAFIHTYGPTKAYAGQFRVDPETVGQYIGVKDKDGKQIFEGDIVRRHEEPFNLTDVGVVVYNEAIGSFRLHVENNGTITRYDFVTSDIYNDGYYHVECKATFEVIGNKFKGLKRL